jgi:hypothetical protein
MKGTFGKGVGQQHLLFRDRIKAKEPMREENMKLSEEAVRRIKEHLAACCACGFFA